MRRWSDACRFCKAARAALTAAFRLLVFIASCYGCWLIYQWTIDSSPAVVFGAASVEPTEAKHYQTIMYYQNIHKLRDCRGDVHRVLFGECGYQIVSDEPAILPAGYDGRKATPILINDGLLPGACYIKEVARYICNPLDIFTNRQTFESPPAAFKVVRWQP